MNKQRNILLVGLIALLFGCGQKKLLNENETKICQSLSFDQNIAETIKYQTKQDIQQTPEISEYGEILGTKGIGLCSLTDENSGYNFVVKEKENFRSKGYLLFVFDDDNNKKYLGTIKGHDELDIVSWRKTNGINYSLENKDIIEKLKVWKEKNDFIILGASMDWVQFQFKTSPNDIETFAKEVYEFCPDAIDQGAGNMPNLIKSIREMNGIFLWWD